MIFFQDLFCLTCGRQLQKSGFSKSVFICECGLTFVKIKDEKLKIAEDEILSLVHEIKELEIRHKMLLKPHMVHLIRRSRYSRPITRHIYIAPDSLTIVLAPRFSFVILIIIFLLLCFINYPILGISVTLIGSYLCWKYENFVINRVAKWREIKDPLDEEKKVLLNKLENEISK